LADEASLRTLYAVNRDAIEARFVGRVLPLNDAIVRRWGAIAGRVRRDTGHPPSVIDTLLAATAIEEQLHLVTRNTKDVQHTGAAVFNPWQDDSSRFRLLASARLDVALAGLGLRASAMIIQDGFLHAILRA